MRGVSNHEAAPPFETRATQYLHSGQVLCLRAPQGEADHRPAPVSDSIKRAFPAPCAKDVKNNGPDGQFNVRRPVPMAARGLLIAIEDQLER